jgi:pimeloyl-ACP methyl ester carboxylesterase
LLHQTPASSDEYSLLIPYLAKSFRVLAMDTMGYGMSDFPPANPTIADYARHVKEFMAALKVPKAHVFGHHTGATIAVEFAAAYPQLVDRLVLSGCPLYTPEARAQRQATAKTQKLEITADGALVTGLWNLLKTYNPDAGPEFWLKSEIAGLQPGVRREDAHHAVFFYDEQKRMPAIKAPTLVLSGSKDLFLSLLDATKKLIPGSETQVIEGPASLIALTAPEALAKAVTDFLNKK